MNARVAGFLLIIPMLLAAVGPERATAQESTSSKVGPLIGGEGVQRPVKPPPPPGLPGAVLNRDRAAPAEKLGTDMPPNEALFDAINRGDIASARDAVNRGADVAARNVLGMTPLDLSIDLSRNDITFLLISLRGGASEPPVAQGPTAARTSARPTGAVPSRPVAAAPPRPVVPAAPTAPRQQAQSQAPARTPGPPFTPGSPGTPNPQAGFLGFGS